jgi:hypothetical protein
MKPILRCIAGIDVHKKILAVVVRRQNGAKVEYVQKKFGTMRSDIVHLAAWLQHEGVTEVVMGRRRNIGGRCGMDWRPISSCI